ncbi:MAG: hypothetical protein MJ135_01845 [Oscillospiraceae bacterium]|nr:hypothetical protein [Oscillospiraceae bacterium]
MRKLSFFIMILAALLGIACVVFAASYPLRLAVAAVCTAALLLVLKYAKCPECGTYSLSINPFSKKYGTCRHCGAHVDD